MITLRQVELGVLGPLQVRQYGLPVAIPGTKPRAILTMLGLYGGSVVSAETLLQLLWGDDPPRTSAKALQTHISALRRTLGDGFVLTEGTGWTLTTAEVDATRYTSAAKMARDAVAAGDTSQAVTRFNEALALWRGTPELPDGPRGAAEKTRWIEGHAALVEDRADALLATGRAAEIIGELEAAVADAPLRERRWGQLMLALYRAGRQGEALGAYQRARSLLADELGVDPGPDLRRLETAIVAQDAALEISVSQHLSVVTRAVTFLLTDIEGSTAAWEADANAMAVALARHDELIEQVVTSRGGRLIKTRGEGDATFSVFDRPSAAASAAIEMQEVLRNEPWELQAPMRIRVALHTGEVEFRDGDYFGRAVNRAARLRSLAAGGQILCSGATAELVIDTLSDDVILADLGMRQLKNLARPEHVFELRLESADDQSGSAPTDSPVDRPALPAVLAGPGPFVGRGIELERLLSGWQTTLAGGMRAVLIAGEPGVGKTRLAGEWSRHAYEQGAFVLYGRCDEDLGAPYQPFAEALRSLAPCLGSSRLRKLRGVEALLPLVPGLTEVLPDLAAPTRADPDTERYALFDAVVAMLAVASANAPVVLILDDLHWATKPTLLLLRHLLRFGENARVQIVGTYRSTDLDRSHPLAAMLADLHRDGSADRLALSGLDQDDVTAYVAEAGYDDEELARALASVTGGNPFFLIEALRHVDESGGRWDPSTLPQGVREAVSRRLSRLPAETNKALAAAAVVGSRFALDLVERVVGEDLIDAFDEACQAGIVIEEPGGRYRFNHAIVRQSLLAELASVRRMRLHQRIATTLESEPGADDELLAELAHHYFECAWAGNAGKAVEYCRRAADQAMSRLAYEGAADLYDRALHALEELDDEMPDRDDVQAELLVARCEALLAAGDVTSAAGAVSQLKAAATGSARLAAWGTCFDGQLSMLTDPERLDDIESAVSAAADELSRLDDAAGEAQAHTVRAACLARLGRIGDAETALDHALTAARRAKEHRRVNAVLAGAPLAALWGPNPVPRAGGRCLDVVRLLRITTGSPVVEATSTRCQGVLDAFRGRAAAGRQLIDSARRSLTELGMRHALLEVDQFAGLLELIADDPAAAEPHLRRAYNGFRRMGLEADTAETAAFLARACLALDRDDEADELCSESERLAGHALKASIAWRTGRAQLLARSGAHEDARRVAEEAVAIAERTDALVEHGDACLTLAIVLRAAGDATGALAAAERAVRLYELKGAAALAEKARNLLAEPTPPSVPLATPEPPQLDLDNACVRAAGALVAAIDREAWDEVAQLFAPRVSVESRRKVVGFARIDIPGRNWPREMRRYLDIGLVRQGHTVAARGERLALVRLELGTEDKSLGAPRDDHLQVIGLDEQGRIDVQVWFDVDDIDAAMAELDAQYARLELDNLCVRTLRRMEALIGRGDWDEFFGMYSPDVVVESRRKIVGFTTDDIPSGDWPRETKRLLEVGGSHHIEPIAVRGERLALTRLQLGTPDVSPGAPIDESLLLIGLDRAGKVALQLSFEIGDAEAALAELDATYDRFQEQQPPTCLDNAANRVIQHYLSHFATRDWDVMAAALADDVSTHDRRPVVNAGVRHGRDAEIENVKAVAGIGCTAITSTPIATRGERLVLSHHSFTVENWQESFDTETIDVVEINADNQIVNQIGFDAADIDAAVAELDARYLAGEAAAHAHAWSVIADAYAEFTKDLMPDLRAYVEVVHRLNDVGVVVTSKSRGTSADGFEAERRVVLVQTVDGDSVVRSEVFDEADLDAALARFDALRQPTRRLENMASIVTDRFLERFNARDWDALTQMLTEDIHFDDRRRVVNADLQIGRDLFLENFRAAADLGAAQTTNAIATRGDRLVLTRARFSLGDGKPEEFGLDLLHVIEVATDGRLAATVTFDPEDIGAAFEELDARYLAGEGATYAHTWSVILGGYAASNRRELPATTPDWATIDHRRAIAFAPGDLAQYMHATWDVAPDSRAHAAAVHRLNHVGAVVTQTVKGASQQGFYAEWQEIVLLTVEGDLLNRCELFDEADLDAALARFDHLSRPARVLENAATRAFERFETYFASRDWDALRAIAAPELSSDDRRRTVNVGVLSGVEAEMDDVRATADAGFTNMTSTVIATRGERVALTLTRAHASGDDDPETFHGDAFNVIVVDAKERFTAVVVFDVDDMDAAVTELDARFVADEAAAHAQTWSVIANSMAARNKRQIDPTTTDIVTIDHRRVASFAPGEGIDYTRAGWAAGQDIEVYIEAVNRLSDHGAVFTWAGSWTSPNGFAAELRGINLIAVDGGMLSRSETFDETDLDDALAWFDELSRRATQLENTASRVYARLQSLFDSRDWDALAQMISADIRRDDRRRIVGSGVLNGRPAAMAGFRAMAQTGAKNITSVAIATRGTRLALCRTRVATSGPDALDVEAFQIVEVDGDERLTALITFDLDDIDAAVAELDARYAAGEAAAHARTWSVIAKTSDAYNRREPMATTADWINIDHRRTTSFASGDMAAFLHAAWDHARHTTTYIETVHQLNDLGALITHVTSATSDEGFDAEWRVLAIFTADGDLINRCELFDEADFGVALARFDELSRPAPQLENAATRVYNRFIGFLTARDWDNMVALIADDVVHDDRRKVINAGMQRGREAQTANLRAAIDVGARNIESVTIATRGEHLALTRNRVSGGDQQPEAYSVELLTLLETDTDNRVAAAVQFDLDDFDEAIAELDARYLAGDAAVHAPTWSLVSQTLAAANRHVLPSMTPDWVNIDHRRVTTIQAGDLTASFHAAFGVVPDLRVFIRAVHRLSDLGSVISYAASGSSKDGFAAEWREISLMLVKGGQFTRTELFDEKDLDSALARFDELNGPTPRLENTATQIYDRWLGYFAIRDWDAMVDLVAEDISNDDRRRVVNGGIQRGKDAVRTNMQAVAEVGVRNIEFSVIAIRGDRLALTRQRVSGAQRPEAFGFEVLTVIEIDADGRFCAGVAFDLEDVDAAFTELDSRYRTGEAALHAATWSVVARISETFNRRQFPAATRDCVNLDHRRGAAFGPGDLSAYMHAAWDLSPEAAVRTEAVHRLTDFGALVTHTADAVSPDGFAAEWRVIGLYSVEGDLISRCEIFDEADIDTAITRFDQLSRSPNRLENAASHVGDRTRALFAAHDWDAVSAMLDDDICVDDRRRVVSAPLVRGRDAEIANMRAFADVGITNLTATTIATRGERLYLSRARFSGRDQQPNAFYADILDIIETNADNRVIAHVVFDAEDLDTAFDELEKRYLAGEAAAHAHVWAPIAEGFSALRRQELPATTPDFVNADHRRGVTFSSGAMLPYIRAAWDVSPTLEGYVESVHELDETGAVITLVANGSSQAGFDAEWREVAIFTVDGGLVSRCELFDETDLDAALSRLTDLRRRPQLENAASRVYKRYNEYFVLRDWDAMAEITADDICTDDRRRVVSGGIQRGRAAELASMRAAAELGVKNVESAVLATRGDRLALIRARVSGDHRPEAFGIEVLIIVEIDDDDRCVAGVMFDLDDMDAALKELETRYIAGEAAAHSLTWSVIANAYASLNRHEFPATSPDWVNIDHRGGATFAQGDLIAFTRAGWEDSSDFHVYIDTVHRLSDIGAVVGMVTRGTSKESFEAEWREITVTTIKGEQFTRSESFDDADLEAALARFDELNRPLHHLENAATQATERFRASFVAQDWAAMADVIAEDIVADDRRRVVNTGVRRGRDVFIADNRAAVEVGAVNMTVSVIATRGNRLALSRARAFNRQMAGHEVGAEVLGVVEVNADGRMTRLVSFDATDIDAAFEELDARFLHGEAAAYAQTWSVITRTFAASNRHELPPAASDWVNIDHRRATSFEPGELNAYIRSAWEDMPDGRTYIAAVHRLSSLGAVITHLASGSSGEGGFEAEWRDIDIMMVDGGLISRGEIFDEADLETALARFDELCRPATQLHNDASRIIERFLTHFAPRDWDALASLMTDDFRHDDRRRVVGSGVRIGREKTISDLQEIAELWPTTVKSTVIATRGERLVLTKIEFSARDQGTDPFVNDAYLVVETTSDGRMEAAVVFDVDELDAAFDELDARYLAGEAAAHTQTWSAVAQTHSAFNRFGHVPGDGWITVDHRRGYLFASDALSDTIRAARELTPDMRIYIETVHRLSDRAIVLTNRSFGSTTEGFAAEWRMVQLMTVDSGRVTGLEIFDDVDLEDAIAKFDEINACAPRLENAASRLDARLWDCFAALDWAAAAALLAGDHYSDDRRAVVGSRIRRGRAAEIEDMRSAAVEFGPMTLTSTVIATRGERLVLSRCRYSGRGAPPDAFLTEVLRLTELDDDGRSKAVVMFSPDDVGAAIEELDARYLAGEAAPHAATWSAVIAGNAALNRSELPPFSSDGVTIDHRRAAAFAPGEMVEYLRAGRELGQNIRTHVEVVHRLSASGAVYTHAGYGVSGEGFHAEWRGITLLTIDGGVFTRCEIFDESDLDAALARFEELTRTTTRLENAASKVDERFWAAFRVCDWSALSELVAEDILSDDRRHVVNAGVSHGRDAHVADARAVASIGPQDTASSVVAIRGELLALVRVTSSNNRLDPGELSADVLCVVEIDADDRIVTRIGFDGDDIDAALAELDARYLAGEAAVHAQTWSTVAGVYAGFNRGVLPATTAGWASVDSRRVVPVAPGDMPASIRAVMEQVPGLRIHVEAVHRLTDRGVVISHVAQGASQEGFDAEWRMIFLFMTKGDLVSRYEFFDESDLDTALARFDELNRQQPQHENSATRARARVADAFNRRDFNDFLEAVTADGRYEDRRKDMHDEGPAQGVARVVFDAPKSWRHKVEPVAFRGDGLALIHDSYYDTAAAGQPTTVEFLTVNQVRDGLLHQTVCFDIDDVDAAFKELEARYLTGEAAAHAHAWSTIVDVYDAFNQHKRPVSVPETARVDHRSLVKVEAYDLDTFLFLPALWDLTPEFYIHVEVVHRLSGLGTVVTHAAHGVTTEGFDAEWRVVILYTVDGDAISRWEIFDEEDLDAALARFDQLSSAAPQLENTATQTWSRMADAYNRHDIDDLVSLVTPDGGMYDRRKGLKSAIEGLHRRNNLRTILELSPSSWRATVVPIAIRGASLALTRTYWCDSESADQPVVVDALAVVEVSGDGLLHNSINFDPDDFEAAFAELNSRYLSGEAAAHANTWSAISEAFASFNRRELPATTPDWLNIDHRRGGSAFPPGEQIPYIHATWEVAPEVFAYAEVVHRLNGSGAVMTQVVRATSRAGFDAEWREVTLVTVEGNALNRCEIYDQADLEVALATFDELSRPKPQLENAAARAFARVMDAHDRRDLDSFLALVSADGQYEDRRKALGDKGPIKPDFARALFTAAAPEWLGDWDRVAIRGQRLMLCHFMFRDHSEVAQPIAVEALLLVEVADDELISRLVIFDPDDLDAAYAELDARFLAGDAKAHAPTWSVISTAYSALNRRELPTTTPNWTNVDRRRGTGFTPGNLFPYMTAAWDLTPDRKYYVEAVHQLSDSGAVVTCVARGSSDEGFFAEWRMVPVITVEGKHFSRCEVYDEADLDAALARFDELNPQAPQLDNVATRTWPHLVDAFHRRDVDAFVDFLAPGGHLEDRRRSMQISLDGSMRRRAAETVFEFPRSWRFEIHHLVIRGSWLSLSRQTFRDTAEADQPITLEMFMLTECGPDNLVHNFVIFDPDNFEAALAEIDRRYLEGEAAAHAQTWSRIMRTYDTFNRHELCPTTEDWVDIDHRRGIASAPGEMGEYVRLAWEVTPDAKAYVECVHRLSDRGALVTAPASGTSPQGFDGSWREVQLLMFDGDLISRCELFDESDLDAALARFDELDRPAAKLENAATRHFASVEAAFNRRDPAGFLATVNAAGVYDDRRKGLRNDGPVDAHLVRATVSEAAEDWRLTIEPIAIRGDHLALSRYTYRDTGEADHPIAIEALVVTEANDELADYSIAFDPDDINDAFAELTARWIASGEVAHPDVITFARGLFEATNRHDWDAISNYLGDATYVSHRQLGIDDGDISDYLSSIRMFASLVPDLWTESAEMLGHSANGILAAMVMKGTSTDGTLIEIPTIHLAQFDGRRVTHLETYDPQQRDAALARFAELNG